jgi:hypothetical protein
MANVDKDSWLEKEQKALTEEFINHIYKKYYESYNADSNRYEKLNNRLFTSITLIGFSATILIGLKEILITINKS